MSFSESFCKNIKITYLPIFQNQKEHFFVLKDGSYYQVEFLFKDKIKLMTYGLSKGQHELNSETVYYFFNKQMPDIILEKEEYLFPIQKYSEEIDILQSGKFRFEIIKCPPPRTFSKEIFEIVSAALSSFNEYV